MHQFYTCAAVLSLSLWVVPVARSQASRPVRITTYYDSARTQRRAVYEAIRTGPRPDTVAHGTFRRFWRAGSLEELGHFTTGQADSIWTRYYPAKAGQPAAVARRLPMRAGQPDGAFVVFHPDGRVAQRGVFRRGQLVDSLVTAHRTGQPRLLAHFDSSRGPGLRGTFRQWRGAYTSRWNGFDWFRHQGEGLSTNNPYPAHDSTRYWMGQLGAGRLVGAFTEHDADGEPRVRVSYTAQGQQRLVTVYYPAAWLRNEQSQDQPLPPDSVVHSRPLYEWQAVGRHPYLLQRHWAFSYGSTSDIAEVQLFRMVPYSRNKHAHLSDIIGTLDRPLAAAPLPAPVATAFFRPMPSRPELACSGLATQYVAHGRPPLEQVAVADGPVMRRYPSLRSYQPPVGLEKMRDPGRWRLGPIDTTGATTRPARQRVTPLANGRRLVEQARTTHTYYASGTLESSRRHRLLGGTVDRDYYATGTRREIIAEGWLGSLHRTWDPAGHLTRRDYESPLDGLQIENALKRAHPFRALKKKLRRFRPLQPLKRALWKAFPRHDHHTPRPSKG